MIQCRSALELDASLDSSGGLPAVFGFRQGSPVQGAAAVAGAVPAGATTWLLCAPSSASAGMQTSQQHPPRTPPLCSASAASSRACSRQQFCHLCDKPSQ